MPPGRLSRHVGGQRDRNTSEKLEFRRAYAASAPACL
jgi:hypothetical protein